MHKLPSASGVLSKTKITEKMAFFKVSCLVVLMVVGVALSAEIKREALESAEQKDDLEGAETIFLGKKLCKNS